MSFSLANKSFEWSILVLCVMFTCLRRVCVCVCVCTGWTCLGNHPPSAARPYRALRAFPGPAGMLAAAKQKGMQRHARTQAGRQARSRALRPRRTRARPTHLRLPPPSAPRLPPPAGYPHAAPPGTSPWRSSARRAAAALRASRRTTKSTRPWSRWGSSPAAALRPVRR